MTRTVVSIVVNGEQSRPRGMRVYYGLIASSNQVIKDAIFRNNLNKSLGGKVLYIKIEAAGLIIDFPCIVIQGIYNYTNL